MPTRVKELKAAADAHMATARAAPTQLANHARDRMRKTLDGRAYQILLAAFKDAI